MNASWLTGWIMSNILKIMTNDQIWLGTRTPKGICVYMYNMCI